MSDRDEQGRDPSDRGQRRRARARTPVALPEPLRKLARRDPDRRFMATHFHALPAVCREAACRRARRCTVENAPCLERHGCWYDDGIGELYRSLNEGLPDGSG